MSTATTSAPGVALGGPPPVRLLGGGPRRWRWLGLGVALMVVGALVAALAVNQLDDRQGVLVAGADLPAGHVITAADLRVAELAGTGGLSVIPGGSIDETIGRTVTVPVAAGGVLSEASLGSEAAFPVSGEAIVGAALRPGRFPVSLRAGTAVSIVITAEDGADRGVQAYPARVQSFTQEEGGTALAEFLVDTADAAQVASAAAGEQITVVQVSPQGGT